MAATVIRQAEVRQIAEIAHFREWEPQGRLYSC